MSDTQHKLAHVQEMPREGETIADRYQIQSVLGEGGFAAVFRAFDTRVDQDVAVKVLDPMMSRRSQFAARFDREIRTVSSLKHPNTISVMDRGTTDRGCLYLVMELLEGVPLDDELQKNGPLSEARVARIATQLLKSLAEAHDKGIMHRDIKPANIFLTELAGEEDFIKVLDFGIAKSLDDQGSDNLTQTGELMCSPHYVAPERVRETRTLPASDIYSVGVMMIELLTGRPPIDGESPMSITIQHAMMDQPVPIPPEISNLRIAPVLRAAVAKPLDQRYTTAMQMVEDLQSVMRGQPAIHAAGLNGTQELRSAPNTSRLSAFTSSDPAFEAPHARKGAPVLALVVVAALVVLGAGAALYKLVGIAESPPQSAAQTAADNQQRTETNVAPDSPPAPTELAIPAEPALAEPAPPTPAQIASTGAAATTVALPLIAEAQAIAAAVSAAAQAAQRPTPTQNNREPARPRTTQPEPRRTQVVVNEPEPTRAPEPAQTVTTPAPEPTPEPTPAPARPSRFTREIAPR